MRLQMFWAPCCRQGHAAALMEAVDAERHERVSAKTTTERAIGRDSTVGKMNMPRIWSTGRINRVPSLSNSIYMPVHSPG